MAGIEAYNVTGPSGLIRSYRAITPHASEELPNNIIALFATVAGNVTVTTVLGDTVILPIAAGGYLPIEPRLVTSWASGGSALGANTLFACFR